MPTIQDSWNIIMEAYRFAHDLLMCSYFSNYLNTDLSLTIHMIKVLIFAFTHAALAYISTVVPKVI